MCIVEALLKVVLASGTNGKELVKRLRRKEVKEGQERNGGRL